MSDTPKTDAQRFDTLTARGIRVAVPAEFAQDLERELAASHAREVVLREALVDYKGRCRECGGSGAYLTEGSDEEAPDLRQCQWCDHALIALTQLAPPVVTKSVADGLAEVLRHVTSVFSANSGRYYETMGEDNPRLTSLAQAIEKANATLAKYKEGAG